ncbi:MAG: hypothetical protein LBN00_01355 [Oscillospiraceae bacterium]|nr:hypothetical protein [Oscillospiraceae bacterium]
MNKRKSVLVNSGFFICAALFALGVVAGVCAAALLPTETPMGDYVSGLGANADAAFGLRFGSSLLSMGKFHLAALLLAFSLLGAVGAPVVTGIRGFLLGFTVTSLARYCGAGALLPLLGLFAPEFLIAVPCLLLLSAQAVEASVQLFRRTGPYGDGFFRRVIAITAATACAAAIDAAIAPALLKVISAHFPT